MIVLNLCCVTVSERRTLNVPMRNADAIVVCDRDDGARESDVEWIDIIFIDVYTVWWGMVI